MRLLRHVFDAQNLGLLWDDVLGGGHGGAAGGRDVVDIAHDRALIESPALIYAGVQIVAILLASRWRDSAG